MNKYEIITKIIDKADISLCKQRDETAKRVLQELEELARFYKITRVDTEDEGEVTLHYEKISEGKVEKWEIELNKDEISFYTWDKSMEQWLFIMDNSAENEEDKVLQEEVETLRKTIWEHARGHPF